jgi:hypothetical protein
MRNSTYFLPAGAACIDLSTLAGSIPANAAEAPPGLNLNYRYE